MLVTVLLPVFNAENTVGAALESILGQTLTDLELIAIDDSSTDATASVLARYASQDERVRLVRTPANLGMGGALSIGLKHATGDLVARMDADDESMPTRLEAQAGFLSQHPDVSVVGTGAFFVDAFGRSRGSYCRPEHHEDIVARMFKENPFIDVTTMMRKQYLAAIGGYDRRLRRSADADAWLRGYRTHRFHNLQTPLVQVRMGRNQRARTVLLHSYVLARAALREGRPISRGWYAPRCLLRSSLANIGLLPPRHETAAARALLKEGDQKTQS